MYGSITTRSVYNGALCKGQNLRYILKLKQENVMQFIPGKVALPFSGFTCKMSRDIIYCEERLNVSSSHNSHFYGQLYPQEKKALLNGR